MGNASFFGRLSVGVLDETDSKPRMVIGTFGADIGLMKEETAGFLNIG